MAVFTLQTLAPRGVSVVRDGQNVGLRLGAESRTTSRITEVRINPRRPSRNGERGPKPAQQPDDHAEYDRMAAVAAEGAGRSLRCDGVLSRRSPARIGDSAIPLGWPRPHGAPKFTTAKRLSSPGMRHAVGNAAAVARPLPLNATASMGCGSITHTGKAVACAAVKPSRLTPAGRTPSASTWAS